MSATIIDRQETSVSRRHIGRLTSGRHSRSKSLWYRAFGEGVVCDAGHFLKWGWAARTKERVADRG